MTERKELARHFIFITNDLQHTVYPDSGLTVLRSYKRGGFLGSNKDHCLIDTDGKLTLCYLADAQERVNDLLASGHVDLRSPYR